MTPSERPPPPPPRPHGHSPVAAAVHTRRIGGPWSEPSLPPRVRRRYRNPDSPEPGWDSERAYWESRSPIIRFGRYLQAQGWYDGQQEEELRKQARKDAIRSLNVAQKVGRPHTMHLFSDVYDEVPWNLEEQEQALLEHMQKYPSSYTEHIESNAKELERWSSGV
jgi:hypothetical protein